VRLSKHRSAYWQGRGFTSSCELLKLGVCDVEIELLEEIEIEHKKDPKRKRCEQKWMECTESTCNIRRADGVTHMKEYWQAYYQENKEEISRSRAEKITCDCGSVVSKRNIAVHRKSKKHLVSKPKLIKINIKRKSIE